MIFALMLDEIIPALILPGVILYVWLQDIWETKEKEELDEYIKSYNKNGRELAEYRDFTDEWAASGLSHSEFKKKWNKERRYEDYTEENFGK